jgi:two-component system chemotaxis sensor kinase CheA
MVHASPVLRLRERLLPLVSLRKLLKLGGSEDVTKQELFIVVAQVGAHQFGIIVDRVFDTEEIVVKPVSPILRDVPFYSGNTILGDGSVIMILDPNGIASAAGQTRVGSGEENHNAEDEAEEGQAKMSFLLFRAGSDELKAVPLGLVARLEQIDLAATERIHGRHVVQYRERLMPLVPFDPNHQWRSEGRQPALVFTEGERSIGMVVDQIVDIVEDQMSFELSSATPGLVGSAIIAGRATDIVDVGYYLTKGLSEWFGSTNGAAVAASASRNILLVDDSAFFRNLMIPVLSVGGWHVTTVDGPDEAFKLREAGQMFDVIVSDIEMPRMDGLAFATEVRSDPRWKDVPMVALSSRVAQDDIAQALKAGFDTYVAKSSRDLLLNTLSGLAARQPEQAVSMSNAVVTDHSFRAA